MRKHGTANGFFNSEIYELLRIDDHFEMLPLTARARAPGKRLVVINAFRIEMENEADTDGPFKRHSLLIGRCFRAGVPLSTV